MKKENLLIEPERKHSRKDLFKMILIGIFFFATAEFLYQILKPFKSHSAPFTDGFFFTISALLIIYFASRKIYHLIEIDYENNNLIIEYINLFKLASRNVIFFASISSKKW